MKTMHVTLTNTHALFGMQFEQQQKKRKRDAKNRKITMFPEYNSQYAHEG